MNLFTETIMQVENGELNLQQILTPSMTLADNEYTSSVHSSDSFSKATSWISIKSSIIQYSITASSCKMKIQTNVTILNYYSSTV